MKRPIVSPTRNTCKLWANLLGAAIQIGNLEQIKLLCKKIAEKDPNNVQCGTCFLKHC